MDLLSSSRAFSLSTPTLSLSTLVEHSEATWKKATKCKKLISWLIMVIIDMYFKKCKKLIKYFLFHLGLYYDQTISSWGSQATLWLSGCSHFCVMSLCIDRQNHPCIQVKRKYFSSVYLKLKCFKLAYFFWISFATLEIKTSHGLGKNKLQPYFCQ